MINHLLNFNPGTMGLSNRSKLFATVEIQLTPMLPTNSPLLSWDSKFLAVENVFQFQRFYHLGRCAQMSSIEGQGDLSALSL